MTGPILTKDNPIAPNNPEAVSLVQRLPRLNDKPPGESISLLLYGKSGSGKTRLAGTLGDRTLYISCGEGEETLKSVEFKRFHKSNPILLDPHETLNDAGIPDNAIALDTICTLIDEYLLKHSEHFDSIVIDDLTFLRKFAMFKALDINQALGKSKTKKEILERFDVIIPAVQDYGVEMNIIEWFISTYVQITKAAKKHFIVLAHEKIFYDKPKTIGEAGGVRKVGIAITGQAFPDTIPLLFDEVWHTETIGGGETTVYRVRTQGDEIITAKSRHGGTFNPTENIKHDTSLLQMFERIKTSQPKGK